MKKYTLEEKLEITLQVLEKTHNVNGTAKAYGIPADTLREWVRNYEAVGIQAFQRKTQAKRTSLEKEMVVLAYLNGEGSIRDLCKKYKIRSTHTLRQWILKYNSHETLTSSGFGGSIMKDGRKTTLEERIEIAADCIANGHNYNETAKKFKVSYQQARNFTLKYEQGGVEALEDRRGKRKDESEMTEVEKLRAEIKLLKAEKEYVEMENYFLKKLQEIERRRG